MDFLRQNAIDALLKTIVESPPPSPLPPPPLPPPSDEVLHALELAAKNLPDSSNAIGLIIFLGVFCMMLEDALKGDEFRQMINLEDFEYASVPIFSMIGCFIAAISYVLAFRQLEGFELTQWGHTMLATIMCFVFAKHMGKISELLPRKAGILTVLGALPLASLAAIQAEQIGVKSCNVFWTLMLFSTVIPLMTLAREWRSKSHDARIGTHRKRFFLFFLLLTFLVLSTPPSQACSSRHKPTQHRHAIILVFDLSALFLSTDGIWGVKNQGNIGV